jgi:hypothetical protein
VKGIKNFMKETFSSSSFRIPFANTFLLKYTPNKKNISTAKIRAKRFCSLIIIKTELYHFAATNMKRKFDEKNNRACNVTSALYKLIQQAMRVARKNIVCSLSRIN